MSSEEREFSILVNATDRSMAAVFTDDPVWIARLEKRYAPYKVSGEGRFYHIPTAEVVRVSRLQRAPTNYLFVTIWTGRQKPVVQPPPSLPQFGGGVVSIAESRRFSPQTGES